MKKIEKKSVNSLRISENALLGRSEMKKILGGTNYYCRCEEGWNGWGMYDFYFDSDSEWELVIAQAEYMCRTGGHSTTSASCVRG